jgi:hypothetical protein
LGLIEPGQDMSPQLLALLRSEQDPRIREELYRALANQEKFEPAAILSLAQNEQHPGARLSAFQLLASALRESGNPDLAAFFNQTAVPELQQAALSEAELSARLAALIALSRARTPQAIAALQQIMQTSDNPRIINSARIALQSTP